MDSFKIGILCHLIKIIFSVDGFDLPISLIVVPPLDTTTEFQRGDVFNHTCTAVQYVKPEYKQIQVVWNNVTGSKIETLKSSFNSSMLDIVLDESYDGIYIQCVCSVYDKKLKKYTDVSPITTKLVLVNKSQSSTIILICWYIFPFLLLLIVIYLAVQICLLIRRRRTRSAENTQKLDIEVLNELYGTNDELMYAQLYSQMYDHRVFLPPQKIPECARIKGYKKPK